MKGNIQDMNSRGTHEINLRVRQTEQSYQQRMQEETQFLGKRPSSVKWSKWEAVFSLIFGSLLANISKPLGKRLHLSHNG